ncbi:MAG: hypothetical protein EZS28_015802 [Streblomastix strix]|uniref:Uncharacterized protein n=1 Tax=Streblomastix strix TaxID=222440 RepID=A0A5J4W2C6_9EUKA|nr:MAG: hypothetical protein EZS28_015802 [Streblomastix strix]
MLEWSGKLNSKTMERSELEAMQAALLLNNHKIEFKSGGIWEKSWILKSNYQSENKHPFFAQYAGIAYKTADSLSMLNRAGDYSLSRKTASRA